MGANVTIYCLDNVTDYFEFERLCHDLMALEGYSSIEPLGGFRDKGRDAIHVDKSGRTTIFAYSVQENWRAKLAEDASKVQLHGHECDDFVFITTSHFTASERDEAVASILNDFGWKLELYGAERLRVMLDGPYSQVKTAHPLIFPRELFAAQARLETSTEQKHLFVSFSSEDSALADWLTQKLTSEGYLVWNEHFKLLGGENYPDNVDEALRNRAFRVIGLYSQASLDNPEVMWQRSIALSIASKRQSDFLIPLDVDGVDQRRLDRVTGSLKFIPFYENWAEGLEQLLEKLKSIDSPRLLPDGSRITVETFLEKDVILDQEEQLFSNCLRVESLPTVIYRFKARRKISYEESEEVEFQWAHRRVHPKLFLSFHQPSPSIASDLQLEPSWTVKWRKKENIDGISSQNLVSELLRKSLIVRSHEKGLVFCPQSKLHYFPDGLVEGNRLKFTRPNSSTTFVKAVGERKYWSETYRYSLAPTFYVAQNLFDDFVVIVRVRVRLSDIDGNPLPTRTAISRRKHLTKDWWNYQWLGRILAVCHYLGEDDRITIGEQEEEPIVVEALPFQVSASLGIDEAALDELSRASDNAPILPD